MTCPNLMVGVALQAITVLFNRRTRRLTHRELKKLRKGDTMSVTFHHFLSHEDQDGFVMRCLECKDEVWAPTAQAAEDRFEGFRKEHLMAGCDDYTIWGPNWVEHETVNLANANAREVLELLGLAYEGDLCGQCPAEELKGRILLADALAPRVALPEAREVGSRGATLIHSARDAGYLDRVFQNLLKVADEAIARNRTVVWG
jgi:hypothetical protein